jgi:hypothetical protein
MPEALLFQRRVAGISLEILSEDGDARATITYPYPDPRFEQGGFPLVFWVLRWICDRLRADGGGSSVFLAELAPFTSSEAPPEAPLALGDLEAWFADQRQGTVGSLQPSRGCWLGAQQGLDELEQHLAPLSLASAEASRARLLLLERETPGARGWDLLHEDGISTLGRWRVDLDETPAPLDPDDLQPIQALLEALAAELAPRLGNGKGTPAHPLLA